MSERSQFPRPFRLLPWCLQGAATIAFGRSLTIAVGPIVSLMMTPLVTLADNPMVLLNTPIADQPQLPDRPQQLLKTELPKLDLRIEPKVEFKLDPKVDPTINLIKPKVPVVSDPERGILGSPPVTPQPIPIAPSETAPTIDEPLEPGSDPELGTIKIRETPPSSPPPAPRRATSLYLLGHFDYFQTNNVFSSIPLHTDGALRTGLSLYYLPPLGPKTYLLLLAESSILRYGTSSRLNYDELRLKVGLYQQLTPRLSGEIGWSYKQLTAAKEEVKNLFQGVRFFNEHSLRFDLTRQDPLSPSLKLITGYQFRWNFTGDIEKYDRLLNAGQISLNYKLSPRMEVGLDYQASWTHFTQQSRDDVSHYLGAHLSYELNDRMSFNAFGGRSMGISSEQRIEPNSWIFGLGFNFNIGIF
ncbi:MAG: outer membrane beta-barrel family protein [Alkalinema sp. CAN_BIN05]|nr:outer membrane beta-barrel family protein [Alkalinema sp. CAN_BIN05]